MAWWQSHFEDDNPSCYSATNAKSFLAERQSKEKVCISIQIKINEQQKMDNNKPPPYKADLATYFWPQKVGSSLMDDMIFQ